jgi:hypothetical protein
MMKNLLLSEFGGKSGKLGLQVTGLVLVDDTALGDLVDDGIHLRQLALSLGLVGKGSEFSHLVTHGFGIVTVVQTSFFGLTNSFE